MSRNDELFAASQARLPGGVNSPVRAFRGLSIPPRFIEKGYGSKVVDAEGTVYIDYVGSYGPLILGHAPPRVIDALKDVVDSGTSFGAPTELELAMAEKVCDMVPTIEMVRMVNSGTEAALSAIRLARAATGREGIIKFAGCYHGHADSFLIKAGSGAMTMGVPDSPGVVQALAAQTFIARYNDLGSVETIFDRHPSDVAAIIVEPVAGNMGVVPPSAGFLDGLREISDQHGALLVFDEVMTGFRVARGGAQQLYGVQPDLTVLGKVIGGGLPVGAYGGARSLMEQVAPAGPMYQAGTLSGNPLAMRAGLCQLELLDELNAWGELERKSSWLENGIRDVLEKLQIELCLNRVGSMMTLFFTTGPVVDFESAARSDRARFATFFEQMLAEGIYLAPSPFEAMFVSLAHEQEDLDRTLDAFEVSLRKAYA